MEETVYIGYVDIEELNTNKICKIVDSILHRKQIFMEKNSFVDNIGYNIRTCQRLSSKNN